MGMGVQDCAKPRPSRTLDIGRYRSAGKRLAGFGRALLKPWQYLNKTLPIVLPTSQKRFFWDLLILTFVMYNAIMVPFEAGFEIRKSRTLQRVETCIDLCFLMDILFNFRTAYLDGHGNMVRFADKIAARYLRTWFPVDVLASIPFDLLGTVLPTSGGDHLTLLAFLKTPRLLRLGRLLRFLDRMRSANVFKMVRLMILMCLIAHWIACMWQILYKFTEGRYPWTLDAVAGEGTVTQFMEVFYKSFVLMVGDNVDPMNNLERGLCCVVLVLGACFYATVVGNMALLINTINATSAKHKLRQDMVQDAARYLGLPSDVQDRIHAYFDYLGTYSHPGPDGMLYLKELPRSLFEDIYIWLYHDLIMAIPLFSDCEDVFITYLATTLHMTVYMPGETIFRQGDIGREMHIIKKGHVAVLNKHADLVAMLREGNYFGELALLATSRRTASCVALSHCDIAVMEAAELAKGMEYFPDSAALVQAAAAVRFEAIRLNDGMAPEMEEEEEEEVSPAPQPSVFGPAQGRTPAGKAEKLLAAQAQGQKRGRTLTSLGLQPDLGRAMRLGGPQINQDDEPSPPEGPNVSPSPANAYRRVFSRNVARVSQRDVGQPKASLDSEVESAISASPSLLQDCLDYTTFAPSPSESGNASSAPANAYPWLSTQSLAISQRDEREAETTSGPNGQDLEGDGPATPRAFGRCSVEQVDRSIPGLGRGGSARVSVDLELHLRHCTPSQSEQEGLAGGQPRKSKVFTRNCRGSKPAAVAAGAGSAGPSGGAVEHRPRPSAVAMLRAGGWASTQGLSRLGRIEQLMGTLTNAVGTLHPKLDGLDRRLRVMEGAHLSEASAEGGGER